MCLLNVSNNFKFNGKLATAILRRYWAFSKISVILEDTKRRNIVKGHNVKQVTNFEYLCSIIEKRRRDKEVNHKISQLDKIDNVVLI